MYTTLNRIRECSPCTDGWKKLLNHLGKTSADDEPLSLLTILNLNGFDHALWCFRAVDGFEKEKLLLTITYAREVQHRMPDESKKALDVFERYANGLATQEEFEAARRGADDAYTAAAAARATYIDDVTWAAIAARAAGAADSARAVYAYAILVDRATRSTIKAKQETQLRQLLEKTCTQL